MSTKSGVGMMAGAPPTSPGGMSQKALAAELVERHGWTPAQAIFPMEKWAEQIDAVVAERLNREAEAKTAAQNIMSDHEGASVGEIEEALVDAGLDPMDDRMFAETELTDADPDTIMESTDMFAEPDDSADDSDLDPEALMAEMSTARDEEQQFLAEHGLLRKSPDTLDYIFDGHAGAGPSASERWMSCTASLGASREFLETLTPNQQETWAGANIAARQGTTAHAAAEVEALVLLGRMEANEAATTMIELAAVPDTTDEAYDEEMGEYITEYVDLVHSYAQERGNENVLIETRVVAAVPLTGSHEGEVYEIPGSVDCGVLPDAGSSDPEHRTLVAADLKYGEGIWVGVDENSQAMIYALGLLALMVGEDGTLPTWLTDVVLHIVQPRIDGIKTARITVDDLLTWRDEVLAPALTKALYGEAEGATFVPSEGACQFCPARGGCAALAEDRMVKAAEFFDVQVDAEFKDGPGAFPETGLLTDTRLGELLAQVGGLIDIHKDLKAEAERRLFRGDSVPGFTLVNYSPPRKWKEGADEALEDVAEVWVKKMVTPTQAVKIAEAEPEVWDLDALNDLIDKPDKRPVVAKEGDRRSKWEGRPPEAMFDVESGEQ